MSLSIGGNNGSVQNASSYLQNAYPILENGQIIASSSGQYRVFSPGVNGKVLSTNSANEYGLEWITPVGGGPGGGSLVFKGAYNALLNLPVLLSGGGGGNAGEYYIVNVANPIISPSIDGITELSVNDWIIHSDTNVWQKIDNSETPHPIVIDDLNAVSTTTTFSANKISVDNNIQTAAIGARQLSSEKNIANGYCGLDGGTFVQQVNIPSSIPQAKNTNLTTDLTAREMTANKGLSNGYAPLNINAKIDANKVENLAQSQITNLINDLSVLPSSAITLFTGVYTNPTGVPLTSCLFFDSSTAPSDQVICSPFDIQIIGISIKYLHTTGILFDPTKILNFSLYSLPQTSIPLLANATIIPNTNIQFNNLDSNFPHKFLDLRSSPITISNSLGIMGGCSRPLSGGMGTGQDFSICIYVRLASATGLLTNMLDGLEDVIILTPLNNEILTYESSTSKWKNKTLATGATNLDALTDVAISGPVINQVLSYDGTNFINSNSPPVSSLKTLNGEINISGSNVPGGDSILLSNGTTTAVWTQNISANSLKSASNTIVINTNAPASGNVLTAVSGTLATWQAPAIGNSYTASNLGTGSNVFKELTSNDFKFRSLTVGQNIILTQNTNDISIGTTLNNLQVGGMFLEYVGGQLTVVNSLGASPVFQIQSFSGNHGFNALTTGSFTLPQGTIANRPTGVLGSFRFNNDLENLEYFDGGQWRTIYRFGDFGITSTLNGYLNIKSGAVSVCQISNVDNAFSGLQGSSRGWCCGSGNNIQRPSFGIPGIAYYNTDIGRLIVSTGSSWMTLGKENQSYKIDDIDQTDWKLILNGTKFQITYQDIVMFTISGGITTPAGFGSKNSCIIVPVGTDGEQPLASDNLGAVRYSTTQNKLQFSNGTVWAPVSSSGAPSALIYSSGTNTIILDTAVAPANSKFSFGSSNTIGANSNYIFGSSNNLTDITGSNNLLVGTSIIENYNTRNTICVGNNNTISGVGNSIICGTYHQLGSNESNNTESCILVGTNNIIGKNAYGVAVFGDLFNFNIAPQVQLTYIFSQGYNNRHTQATEYSASFLHNCRVNHSNSFVVNCKTAGNLTTTQGQSFLVSADLTTFYSNNSDTTGVQLLSGTSAWASVCDVNKKELLVNMNGHGFLDKIANVDVFEWQYSDLDTTNENVALRDKLVRNISPTAQGWQAQFPLTGKSDLYLNSLDMCGVLIQALKEAKTLITDLQARVAVLEIL